MPYIILIGPLIPVCFTLAFISPLSHPVTPRRGISDTHLLGVPEWKAKFSASSSSGQSSDGTLPLLLFPFEPTQIPLPGQYTKLTFRHGKYMDMIDESLTNYESVVGMSLVHQDELLPIVVVCEIIGEELDIKSGYRGFSSMEVGLRAVGRMQWDDFREIPEISNTSYAFHGRKPLTDVQIGHFNDYQDDKLKGYEIQTCLGYLKNIESSLDLPQDFLTSPSDYEVLNEQQQLYADAYTFLSTKKRDIAAASWAVFTLLCDESKIPSSIIKAISTTNTAERLRLGLAAILESSSMAGTHYCGDNNSFL